MPDFTAKDRFHALNQALHDWANSDCNMHRQPEEWPLYRDWDAAWRALDKERRPSMTAQWDRIPPEERAAIIKTLKSARSEPRGEA